MTSGGGKTREGSAVEPPGEAGNPLLLAERKGMKTETKTEHTFRDYDAEARASVKEFYRLNHTHQTHDFVKAKKADYLARNRPIIPPHKTVCSPKRSVSVSSRKVVSMTPARVQPMALAHASAVRFAFPLRS